MVAVRDQLERFGPDTVVVLATFTEPQHIDAYLERRPLPFPVLIDADRSTYRAYGLGRGTVRRVWGARMAKRYLEIFREQGFERPPRATEDTLQLGGNFIIDPQGTLIYGYWGEGPDDRPEVDDLVAAIDARRR